MRFFAGKYHSIAVLDLIFIALVELLEVALERPLFGQIQLKLCSVLSDSLVDLPLELVIVLLHFFNLSRHVVTLLQSFIVVQLVAHMLLG